MFCKRKIIICLLLLLFPATVFGEPAQGWVAVLLSDTEKAYDAPVLSFTDSIGMEVRTFNLHGDIRQDPTLKSRMFENKPSMIFTLGAKAAFVAKLWTKDKQDIPVIFAMVINWQKYKLLEGQANMVGISSEVNPGNQFLNLSMFAPQFRRIGVIYSPEHSREIVEQAWNAVKMLGLELIERPIGRGQDC